MTKIRMCCSYGICKITGHTFWCNCLVQAGTGHMQHAIFQAMMSQASKIYEKIVGCSLIFECVLR